MVDYLIFIKLKEWIKTKTSKETPYDKIFNETHTTNWLPSSTSFNSACAVVEVDEGDGDSKKLAVLENKNGFVQFTGNSCPSIYRETETNSTPLSAPVSPSSANGQQDTLYGSVSVIPYADQENNANKTNHIPTAFESPYKSCNDSDFYLSSSRL